MDPQLSENKPHAPAGQAFIARAAGHLISSMLSSDSSPRPESARPPPSRPDVLSQLEFWRPQNARSVPNYRQAPRPVHRAYPYQAKRFSSRNAPNSHLLQRIRIAAPTAIDPIPMHRIAECLFKVMLQPL